MITTPSITLGFQISLFLLLTIMAGDFILGNQDSSVACYIARFEPFSYSVLGAEIITNMSGYRDL